MYECFHCGEKAVSWDSDFDFADYGEEGEGIIHECHCNNCGAQITYRIPNKQEEEEDITISVKDFKKHMTNMREKAKTDGKNDMVIMLDAFIELFDRYVDIFCKKKLG